MFLKKYLYLNYGQTFLQTRVTDEMWAEEPESEGETDGESEAFQRLLSGVTQVQRRL